MTSRAALVPIIAFLSVFVGGHAWAERPLLQKGDRLALVGGTFVERMQPTPWLEAELQVRQPDWQLKLRNLGWSGDDVHCFARKVFDPNPENGFKRLHNDLDLANPTVVLFAYGFAEASNGQADVDRFESGLTRLVESNREKGRRVILMRPFAYPGVRTPGYAERIKACGDIVDKVAAKFEIPALGVTCDQFQADGLLPSEAGYRAIATQLAQQLIGGDQGLSDEAVSSEPYQELSRLITRKDESFFHRHRPQNETYLFLFRKHEQGNNVVELPEFDALVDQFESQIWRLATQVKR
jgi:hypothetical protein